MGSESGQPKKPAPAYQVTADYSERSVAPAPGGAPTMALRAGAALGKYKIIGVLGYGGMGSVYAAKDPLIERDVAIKLLPPELVRDKAALDRFLREARAAGKLNHPNVVTIYEVIQIPSGGYAIVMERVNGGSVQEYLAKKGPPGWRAATRLIGEACKALVAAHEMGLIHRDIKPANLLLTQSGHVKVADFGLAKLESSESTMRTQAGAILGTPAYMSPEQCRGDKIDRRSDIYSLGCAYFAMLTNRPPFEAPSSMQVMFAHCSAPVPDPRDLDADVPQVCVDILTRALAKNPEERYESARQMLADLRTALEGGTIATNDAFAGVAVEEENIQASQPVEQSLSVSPKLMVWGGVVLGVFVIAAVLAWWLPGRKTSEPQAVNSSPAKKVDLAAMVPAPVETPAEQPATAPVVISKVEPATKAVVLVPAPTTKAVVVEAKAQANVVSTAAPASVPPPPPRAKWPNDSQMPNIFVNSVGVRMHWVHAGKFIMGNDSLPNAPRHEVTLTEPFYIGVYEISMAEFKAVMGDQATPPGGRDDLARTFLTWEQADEYCRRLSERPAEQKLGRVYRLPTEAEWEYACRAGTTTRYAYGNTLTTNQANFGKDISIAQARPPGENGQPPAPPPQNGSSRNRQQGARPNGPPQMQQHPLEPRGRYPANAWGLYDMEGSVWEWCSDYYSADFDMKSPQVDPQGAPGGATHVARGGCWASPMEQCASAYRDGKTDENQDRPIYGFRIVCQLKANP